MRNFWSRRDGNVAITFAILLVPLVGFVGVALDYSMATAYRTDLQKALDATALALTKIMPADQATLDAVGNQYFHANLGPHTLTNLQLSVTPDVGTLKVSVKGTYNVQLAHIIGATSVDIGASAEAKWSVGKVEIALVLDNSWSMDSLGRMTELKKAANNLLQVLQAAVREEDDAKVAIVPFDSRVNVGTTNVSAAWLKWNVSTSSNGVCSNPDYDTRNSCTSSRGGIWTATNAANWDGCVWDRDKSNDVQDTLPGDAATAYPAWQCRHGISNPNLVVTILPLTSNWGTEGSDDTTTLFGKIKEMKPSGYTNITVGMVWGWHALSKDGVLTDGSAYDAENRQKYIILLSDGDNTRNRHEDSESTMNSRTRRVCDNIRAVKKPDGTNAIVVYTIRLIDGDAELLSYCATDPDKYKEVENASELSGVFSAIGSQIANLHLSK